jgi:hypothetical protein
MTTMKPEMQTAQRQLTQLFDTSDITSGMYVRVRGQHLIAGRKEPTGPRGALEDNDRVRFTRLNSRTFGLSVKRHTGRWERTPFSGTLPEMVQAVWEFMQHLVASY